MIVNIRYSQLSNRLALLAHVLATAIVEKRDLLITVFEDLKGSYVCRQPKGIHVTMCASRFWAAEKKFYGVLRRVIGDRLAQRLSLKLGIVSFWLFRNQAAVDLAQDEVRAFFTPHESCVRYAQSFEAKYFAANQLRIGVHIRRGDYRTWQGGRYWYSDAVYQAVIGHLLHELETRHDLYSASREKLIVLFSDDDTVKAETFAQEGCSILKSCGSAMDDHYLMSKCHLLVGPPSTFTLWASWYGKVPLCHIQNATHLPALSEFKWNKGC